MRKALLAAVLTAVPTVALAQEPTRLIGYAEFAAGIAAIPDVNTKTYTIDTGSGIFVGHAEGHYGAEFTAGGELGLTAGQFRFGVSYDYLTAKLDRVTAVGTLDGTPISDSITGSQLESYGISADNNVSIIAANAYWNLPLIGTTIRPYVGVGIGAGIIEKASTELALTATLGARVALTNVAYLGARYRFGWIAGPTDDLGIQYDPLMVHTFSIVLGFYFG